MGMKRPAAAKCGLTQPAQKEKPANHGLTQPVEKEKPANRGLTQPAWNKGKKPSKTSKQHVFIPKEQLELFFAVALFFTGPVYCAALWLCLVTSRRISETLLLRGTDVQLIGGDEHDAPHILYQQRVEDRHLRGNGKLGKERLVARLSSDAVLGLKRMQEKGLEWECLPVLESYRAFHPETFNMKPMQKKAFILESTEDYVFPSQSKKKGCRPNLARQSINAAMTKIREVMFALTKNRRWNPGKRFQGNRVTVHGATRHTSAHLLLFNPSSTRTRPSEEVIMEIQQRSDARVLRKHYFHADDSEVKDALEYGSAPSPFKQCDGLTSRDGLTSQPLSQESTKTLECPNPGPQQSSTASSSTSRRPMATARSQRRVQEDCPKKQHEYCSRNVT